MRKKAVSVFLLIGSLWTDEVEASRYRGTSNNQWRYSAEYNEFQSSYTSGYTSGSHYYGIRVGYAWENDGWSFVTDFGAGSLYGRERLNDNGTIRHVNIQDVVWSLNITPRFHMSIGDSSRLYIGMGGAGELHYTKLPTTITYSRVIPKDIQFAFGSVYLIGFDMEIGDSSKIFIEYSVRNAEAPLYNLNAYKVIGPQAILGFTW